MKEEWIRTEPRTLPVHGTNFSFFMIQSCLYLESYFNYIKIFKYTMYYVSMIKEYLCVSTKKIILAVYYLHAKIQDTVFSNGTRVVLYILYDV